MTSAFDAHLQSVVARLNDRLGRIDAADHARRDAEVLMAKHGLHDVCFQELITFAERGNPPLAAALRALCGAHAQLFQAFAGVVQGGGGASGAAADGGGDAGARALAAARADARRAEADAAELFELAEALEDEARAHHAEMAETRERFKRLQLENTRLKRENDSRARAAGLYGAPPTPPRAGGGGSKSGAAAAGAGSGDVAAAAAAAAEGGGDEPGAAVIKVLPLKVVKETIETIYASKEKYDAKCKEQRMPRETLEQHMYSFLNQRCETAASTARAGLAPRARACAPSPAGRPSRRGGSRA